MWFFKDKPKSTPSYEEILKKNPSEINYFELRMAYTKTDYYNPYGGENVINELSNLFDEGKFKEIIQKVPELFVPHFVNIDFHMIVFSAAKQLNDNNLLSFHGFVANKLIDSILDSGDGKTPESAYVVINTNEEYALIGVLGLKMKAQSLLKIKEKNYDLLEVVDGEGNDTKIYFNIDLPFKWLGSKMG